MAGLFCGCVDGGINPNTGRSAAELVQDSSYGYILVPRVADDGTINQILASDFVDNKLPEAYINQKINEADPSKRWYLVSDFKATTNERADPNTEQPTGGNAQITFKGVRSLTAQLWNVGSTYLKNIEGLACKDLGFYYIDQCGSIFGNAREADKLKPIKIADRTFYARTINATEGSAPKIQLNFEIDQVEKDSDVEGIKSSNLGVDMLDANSLLNLTVEASDITATSFTIQLDLEYGGFESKIGQKGFELEDFKLIDTSDGSDIAITSVTESATVAGQYDFVIPDSTGVTAQLSGAVEASGDLQGSYTKQGFEIVKTQIVIS